jgi:uncharacterized cofD-like protein
MNARIVALGGGHGLSNTLRALVSIGVTPTAIVGVADDGGSSGRIRAELGVLPPGDLRMALAALCPDSPWSTLMQQRFAGTGELSGHSVGNLLIAAAWQQANDPVAGLADLAELIGARGRVLPASSAPLTIHAEITNRSGVTEEIIGQHRVATARENLERVWIEPTDPPSVPQSVQAISDADVVFLGPGSWFTSVLPHLLIRGIREALVTTSARRVLITNLHPGADRETWGLSLAEHIHILHRHAPDLRIDVIVVDPQHADNPAAIQSAAALVGATITQAPVEDSLKSGLHDPKLLSQVLAPMVPQ